MEKQVNELKKSANTYQYWRIFVSCFYLEYLLAKLLALKKIDFVRKRGRKAM